MFERIKNILLTPKTEWPVIDSENKSHLTVATTYVLVLSAIPAIASFVGYGLVGRTVLGIHIASIGMGLTNALTQYITMVGGVYLSAFVISALAPTFGARKNFDKAFSLVAYAWTPMFLAGIFSLLPALSALSIVGLYGFYLLWLGMKPMTGVGDEKQTGYFVVSLLVMLVAYVVLAAIFGAILATMFAPAFRTMI